MTVRRNAAILVVLAALVAAAAVGNSFAARGTTVSAQKPEDFMRTIVRLTVSAHHAEAWALLHPAHQKLAPRSRFVRCRADPPGTPPSRLVSAVFDGKRYERIEIPLIPQHTATAVRLKLVIATRAKRVPAVVTVRAVWIGSRWTWILPASNIPAFRAGRCPS